MDNQRADLERQTNRNLRGLELERAGRKDEAVALYEDNLREGFPGDWPYGRLVSIYNERGQLHEIARVLRRGLDVLKGSTYRSAEDRRALRQIYRRRLREVERVLAKRTDAERAS